jgi:transcriptional regulator
MKKQKLDNRVDAVGRGRGRPALPETERKRPRNLSVSDVAWGGLEDHVKTLQIKTVSELIEKIGLNQIQITLLDDSPLADIPIYRRLKSLISEPVAVFWSTLSFVTRTCHQFNLEPNNFVYDITMRASTIVFYVGYTHPDVLINNPSALLRWLCYRIVKAEALKANKKKPAIASKQSETQADPQDVERYFTKIGTAFHVLETAARSPDYEALKMKTLDGLTVKQISRIFKLQRHDVSKIEVGSMIKRGLANFRLLFYADSTDPLSYPEISSPQGQAVVNIARRYLELALREDLRSATQEMEMILLKTGNDPYLDFWLNEIDYNLGNHNEKIRDQIEKNLEPLLLDKKADIDRKFASCRTMAQIRQLLQDYANREASTELPVEYLLGEQNHIAWNKES